jgi:hypothetical protein
MIVDDWIRRDLVIPIAMLFVLQLVLFFHVLKTSRNLIFATTFRYSIIFQYVTFVKSFQTVDPFEDAKPSVNDLVKGKELPTDLLDISDSNSAADSGTCYDSSSCEILNAAVVSTAEALPIVSEAAMMSSIPQDVDLTSVKEILFAPVANSGAFATIGRRATTDKIVHHGYHRFFPRYIEHYRTMTGGAMLEIGIEHRFSLTMWLEYYPLAFIYGVDYDIADEGPRYKIFKADQSNKQQMLDDVIADLKHPIFLIVDDGSHIPEHQVACFDYLFRDVLMPGGTYIIEDIETSYWRRHGIYDRYRTRYGYHHENSAIEIFKNIADDVNREFLSSDARQAHEKLVGDKFSTQVSSRNTA